ncbi:MAG TPA: DUF3842 family protein [Syntrophomonadaceae bacterium]|nr:DUF3842 family protein [Syntrophomonadaceae bacterium]
MKIAIIDGQGGGIGKHITEKVRKELGTKIEIIALGTNSTATSLMLKAGANEGATGENAVVQTVAEVDVIVGSLSILVANSMLGEVTPKMAEAICNSKAKKILLPIGKNRVEIVGVQQEPLPHMVDKLVQFLKDLKEAENNV